MSDRVMQEIMRQVVLDDAYTREHREYALGMIVQEAREQAQRFAEQANQLAEIDRLAEHGFAVNMQDVNGDPLPLEFLRGSALREAVGYLQRKQKINAIKVIRGATNAGLMEAKHAAEDLALRMDLAF